MQTVEFAWDPVGPKRSEALRILIDGVSLAQVIGAIEKPYASAEGSPNLAGGYAGLARRALPPDLTTHFLGGERSHLFCGPPGKTVLLGCECGEPACWPLMAHVHVADVQMTWTAFEQPHRRDRWLYEGTRFVFDSAQYEAALRNAT